MTPILPILGASGKLGAIHICDDTDGCYYQLKSPFIIDTRQVNNLNSDLVGNVAAGNYNFRQLSIAANVVGTGVLECGPGSDPSCYSTAHVEFQLEHAAHSVPITDYHGESTAFDFGVGTIRRGKAIAAERYLTSPLSSTDLALISQPQFTKPELRGRPLSGAYRLRIYNTENLQWQRVEDIQLMLNYRYWSRVNRSPEN